MSVKQEATKNKNEVKLTFTVEAEKFDEAIMSVFKKSSKYFNIPGFRKGKAPFKIVERYYGDEIFYEDAFNELVPEIYDAEIKANNIDAVSRPKIDVVQMEKGKDLIFTAIVATKPEVKLGKYKGVELEKIEYKATAEDVNHELEHMAEHNSRMVSVEDRAVKDGDIVTIDFAGTVDGVAFDGGTAQGQQLTIGSKTFIPGFEDQIIGMKAGDEKDINLSFPEDYHVKDLAGAPVVFKVKVNEVKEKKQRELDEDFFDDLGMEGIDSEEKLRNEIKESIKAQKEMDAENKYVDAILEGVSKNVDVDIPEEMVNEEVNRLMDRFKEQMKMQGISLDLYYQFTGSTEEQLKSQMEKEAFNNVLYRLMIDEIKVMEKVVITDEEADKEADELAKKYNMKKDEFLNQFGGLEMVKYDLEVRKVVELLKEYNK